MAIPYLAISDNTTTCTMLDGTSTTNIYRLIDFSFGATVESESELGNQPLYQEVECSMTLRIKDSTVPLTYQALQRLHKLLIQAHKFGKEEYNITPVVLRYQPKGSTLSTYLSAVITEYLNPEEVVGRFTEIGDLKGALDVKIKFKRQGQWILNTTTGTTSGYVNPNVLFGSTFTPASSGFDPLDVKLDIQDIFNALYITDGLILLASVPSNCLIRMMANTFSGANFGLAADTVASRAEANILRFMAPDTNMSFARFLTDTSIINQYIGKGLLHAYGTVKNRGGAEFIVRFRTNIADARSIVVDDSSINPRVVYFGAVEISAFIDFVEFGAQSTSIGGQLDFDTFFFLIEVDKAVNAIYINNYIGNNVNVLPQNVQIKTSPLTQVRPTVRHISHNTTGGLTTDRTVHMPYQGDAYLLHTGTTYSGVVITTYNDSWRGNYDATYGLNEFRITPTRYNSYLLPE